MAYPFDDDQNPILQRLEQILEPPKARELRRQGEPQLTTDQQVEERNRGDAINEEWRQELFPERKKKDTWKQRASDTLAGISHQLMQPRDWGDPNEFAAAAVAGADAYRASADTADEGSQKDAAGKLAALMGADRVGLAADKNALYYENMLLKNTQATERNRLYGDDIKSKIADRAAKRTAAIDKADRDADAALLREKRFDLSQEAGQRAALKLWSDMVKAEGVRMGIIGNDVLERFPDQAAIDEAQRNLNAYGERLKTHPLFREVFAMGDPSKVPTTGGGGGGPSTTAMSGRGAPKMWDGTKGTWKKGAVHFGFNSMTKQWEQM